MKHRIDPAKAKIVNGIVDAVDPDATIDEVLLRTLYEIQRLMRCIGDDISTGQPHRNTVMSLKDCVSMLIDLKKHEKDILDGMSAEDIEKLLKTKR